MHTSSVFTYGIDAIPGLATTSDLAIPCRPYQVISSLGDRPVDIIALTYIYHIINIIYMLLAHILFFIMYISEPYIGVQLAVRNI